MFLFIPTHATTASLLQKMTILRILPDLLAIHHLFNEEVFSTYQHTLETLLRQVILPIEMQRGLRVRISPRSQACLYLGRMHKSCSLKLATCILMTQMVKRFSVGKQVTIQFDLLTMVCIINHFLCYHA